MDGRPRRRGERRATVPCRHGADQGLRLHEPDARLAAVAHPHRLHAAVRRLLGSNRAHAAVTAHLAATVDGDAAAAAPALGDGGEVRQPQLDDQVRGRQPLGRAQPACGQQRQRRAQRAAQSIRIEPSHAPMVACRSGLEARDNAGFEASSTRVGQAGVARTTLRPTLRTRLERLVARRQSSTVCRWHRPVAIC
jgi:hypothetical protein